MNEDTVVVFTTKSVESCLAAGGTDAWVLNRTRANQCGYVVLCQNRYTNWGDGKEAHHSAFLIATIDDVVPSTETPGRWLIRFGAYALLNIPEVWKGWRNPVRYTTLEELRMNLQTISFEPMPEHTDEISRRVTERARTSISMEVEAARRKIATMAEVPVGAVKITIEFGSIAA